MGLSAWRVHSGCIWCVCACVYTSSHFSLSAWPDHADHMHTFLLLRLTPSHPILSVRSVCGRQQVCPRPVHFYWLIKFVIHMSHCKHSVKSHRAGRNGGSFFTKPPHTHQTAPCHSLGFVCHLWVSRRAVWDSWKHAVWWRELES